MTRVCVITSSFPETGHDGAAAAGTFVYDFVHSLHERVETVVVAPGKKESVNRPAGSGPKIYRFYAPRIPLSSLNANDPRDWLKITATLRNGQRQVNACVAEQRSDHILALWVLPSGYWAMRAASDLGIDYSTWALGSDIWTLAKIPIVKKVLAQVLRNSKHRYADGLQLAKDVQQLCGRDCQFLSSSRIFPTSGVARIASRPPYRLAYLGRWHSHKGVDNLLSALQRLDEKYWDKVEAIRIAGGGPLSSVVHQSVSDLARQGKPVLVEGYKDRKSAAKLLEWCHAIIIPSRIESVPVIYSDALKARCHIIATPVGDLPQLLSNKPYASLTRGTKPAEITESLERFLQKPECIFPPAGIAEQLTPQYAAEIFIQRAFGNMEETH